MKQKNTILKIERFVLLFLFMILFSGGTIYAQGVQIDMSFGVGHTFLSVHHDHNYKVYDKISGGSNVSYFVGLTGKIKGRFFLRTEMGLYRTDNRLRIDYDYDYDYNGFIKSKVITLSLSNERIYLALLPEFRYSYKKVDFFINAGLVFASDVKNFYEFGTPPSDSGEEYQIDDLSIWESGKDGINGVSANGGINYNFNSIALRLMIGSTFFGKTLLFGPRDPRISYTNTRIALGIVYSVGK